MAKKDSGDPALGAALKAARVKRGLSQAAVAKAAGFTYGWLGNVERGHRGIDARSFGRVAMAIRASVYELLDEVVPEDETWLESMRPFAAELDAVQREEVVRLIAAMAEIRREPVYDMRRVPAERRRRQPINLVDSVRRRAEADAAPPQPVESTEEDAEGQTLPNVAQRRQLESERAKFKQDGERIDVPGERESPDEERQAE